MGTRQGDANNGYIDPSTLAGCLATAKNGGWSAFCNRAFLSRTVQLADALPPFSAGAGVMVWQVRVFRYYWGPGEARR